MHYNILQVHSLLSDGITPIFNTIHSVLILCRFVSREIFMHWNVTNISIIYSKITIKINQFLKLSLSTWQIYPKNMSSFISSSLKLKIILGIVTPDLNIVIHAPKMHTIYQISSSIMIIHFLIWSDQLFVLYHLQLCEKFLNVRKFTCPRNI